MRAADTEGGRHVQVVNGSTSGLLVHKTTVNVNRERIIFEGSAVIVSSNRMSTVATVFGLGEG